MIEAGSSGRTRAASSPNRPGMADARALPFSMSSAKPMRPGGVGPSMMMKWRTLPSFSRSGSTLFHRAALETTTTVASASSMM
jgi:hypothetical protein